MEKGFDFKRLAERLAEAWPSAIVAREQTGLFSGGALNPSYVANLDSAGKGCPRFKIGRKTCYFTKDFADWMQARASIPKRNISISNEEGE